jgi:hypothetical protein
MNEIEKRELIEQQRKIFEAGTQRADKRTGSFSFLTWPFFIAPLIASEEFSAATFQSAAAEERDANAAKAGAALWAANDDPPMTNLPKASAENETTTGLAASSEVHAAQLDQLLAEPQVLAGVAGTTAPVEAAVEPALTSVTDTVAALPNDVAGTTAPVEAAVQPVLATVSDAVGTLPNDVAGTTAPVEAAVEPALTSVTTATAGDVIAFNDAPPPPVDPLFTGTYYTDYGVTMSSDIAVPSQPTMTPADAASAQDTSVLVVADVQQQAPLPPDIVDTTHPIDHLGHAAL